MAVVRWCLSECFLMRCLSQAIIWRNKAKLNLHHIVLLLLETMPTQLYDRGILNHFFLTIFTEREESVENQWSRFDDLVSADRCMSTAHPPVSGNTRKKLKAPQRTARAPVASWERWRPWGWAGLCRVPCSGRLPGVPNSAPAPTARYSSITPITEDIYLLSLLSPLVNWCDSATFKLELDYKFIYWYKIYLLIYL